MIVVQKDMKAFIFGPENFTEFEDVAQGAVHHYHCAPVFKVYTNGA